MSRTSERAKLHLSEQEAGYLQKIARSMTEPLRSVQRARILMKYAAGESITGIRKTSNLSRPSIYKCIDNALAMGAEAALMDKYHRPKEPIITEEAKAWVVNLACTKPKEHGYAAEIWSRSLLAQHTRRYAPAAGHDSLKSAAKATIQRILKQYPLQPHKIKYYLEKRDADFDRKMREVLMVYKEVNMQNQLAKAGEMSPLITVSIDEKPGVQAIKNIAPDLPPEPGKRRSLRRDYEYKRLGTLSILAALDLHDGYVIGQVHKRHRSKEFISLLQEIDAYYPSICTIRIILDNHSAHISKETMEYLKSKPNRFLYVHTPKHGSWLNLVETLFGKMARTFLKHIRVESIEELKERILTGIKEINELPVVHQWKKFDIAEIL